MNKTDQARILKACGKIGLTVKRQRNILLRNDFLCHYYNNSGDCVGFNPLEKIDDAMIMLFAVNGCFDIDYGCRQGFVRCADKSVRFTWKDHKIKNPYSTAMTKSFGNAVVNLANML